MYYFWLTIVHRKPEHRAVLPVLFINLYTLFDRVVLDIFEIYS